MTFWVNTRCSNAGRSTWPFGPDSNAFSSLVDGVADGVEEDDLDAFFAADPHLLRRQPAFPVLAFDVMRRLEFRRTVSVSTGLTWVKSIGFSASITAARRAAGSSGACLTLVCIGRDVAQQRAAELGARE